MINLARDGFTHEQIVKALHSGSVTIDFRYELLDGLNRKKRDLPNITKASIDHSALAQVKRVAKFTINESPSIAIDYLNDRIKPYMRLFVPPSAKRSREYAFFSHIQTTESSITAGDTQGGWVEFPLGVFLLSSPKRVSEGVSAVVRDIDAYDGLIILLNDKFTERHTITAGTRYYDAVISILSSAGITHYNIEQTDDVLSRDIEFAPGEEKLFALNELLRQINFTQMHVDENGYYIAYKYRSPSERSADYVYKTDGKSVIFDGASESLDLFSVPNVFTVIKTNEEEEPLVSHFINDNPTSPTSTVARGFRIVDIREVTDIADQAALDAYTERIAFEASQVYGRIEFETALMPFHGYSNVVQFTHDALGIDGNFLELNWTMDLAVGGVMTHEVRQIIDVGGTP